jgi:DNA-binding CsgD family transcriptional regulator
MAGMLGAYDVMHRGANFRIAWGYEQKYLDSFDYYTSINPTLRPSFRFKAGEVLSIGDLIPLDEFAKYPTYTEWAEPQGIRDVIQAVLEKTPVSMSALALSRGEPVDDEAIQRMKLIAPHFRRSVLIGKVIDLAKIEAATFSNTIDGLAAGVFLIDRAGRLLHANARGDEMLTEGDPLRLADGVVTATNARANRNLSASFAACDDDQASVEQRGLAVPVTADYGQAFVAHVLPMTSGRRRDAVATGAAVAALFVRKVDDKFPAAVEAIAQTYGLTPSETRVLHVLLEVGGVQHTSLLLRLTENTVKTHLRHIFAKTGAGNQVDLVKLAAGYASPLKGRA